MRNAEDLFASNGWQHVDLNVKQAADGLVTVSAKVKDLEGNWLSYIGTVDEAGEITQKSLGKIDKTAALDKRLDTSEIERRRLTQQEMIDDAERVYRELNLSKDAWDVKVDSNGLVTIKDNLADIAGNAAEVTKQFRDADTAIEGFETAFTKASLHISPQKEVKDSQNSSVKDTVDKTLKQRQKAIEDIKRNLDTGKYNVDLNNLNASFAGYRQAGYVGDNSKLEQQITLIIKAKKELKDLYDISKQRDLTDDEANEFVRLGQVIKAASETAGNEVKLLVTDFGALTTEQERLAGENTIRQWLESNSKAAEEFGTQIKELASEMQTAFTAFDKGNIMAKFNQIKMDAAAMGLTGKLPAETISTDNKKRDESIKRIQKEIEEASILSKYNKITDKLTPYKDARLTSPDVDSQIAKIEQLKDALDKLYDKSKTTDFSNDDAEKMVSTYNDLITAMKKAGVEADNLKSAYGNIIDPAKANKSADSMLKWLENNTRAMKKYGKEIEDLAAKQRNTVKGNEFNANEAAMNSIKSSAYKEGLTGKSWTESFKKGLGSISQLFGSFSLVNRADDIARDMVSTIHDVDDALTDLKMATGVSDSAANDLMKTYSLMGRQLKATGVDIAKSSTEWLKQGQTMEDSMTLTKDAMVLSKIGGLSSEQSTEYLTSGMKGYKVAVEDTLGIVDKLSAVDLVSATDVGGLAEGMSRVAVTAENAGRMCARTYRNIWMLFNNIGNYLNRLNSECL